MIRIPAWQDSLYQASIGVATLLDEILDHSEGFDEDDELYRHAEALQLHITRLEGILYKEKTNGF
tara:strand:- start:643 stop:837 length:195 start_codon:yes stop_codon:yes gene_type:complete